jgi:hypothetical protein
MENNPQDVLSAFEILLEEIEAEIEFVNGLGSKIKALFPALPRVNQRPRFSGMK